MAGLTSAGDAEGARVQSRLFKPDDSTPVLEFYRKIIGGGLLIAVAHGHRLGVQPAQQRAILRHKLDVTALRALQHDVAAGGAVGQEGKFCEDVTVELIVAPEALHSARARRGFLFDVRRTGPGNFFDTHTSFPSRDSTSA